MVTDPLASETATASEPDAVAPDAWLVVIDPQAVFADPASEWAAPDFSRALPTMQELIRAHAPRVVLTRWVPGTGPTRVGSWGDYLRTWSFADRPPEDPMFALVPEIAAMPETSSAPVVSLPTFGKVGPDLLAITGPTPRLVLAGVATDCCVISTALAAADAGAWVEVAAEACAGSTAEAHEQALTVMGAYAPQIVVRG